MREFNRQALVVAERLLRHALKRVRDQVGLLTEKRWIAGTVMGRRILAALQTRVALAEDFLVAVSRLTGEMADQEQLPYSAEERSPPTS